MKICLVGDFNEPRDMGERNLAYNLAKALGQHHEVMTIKPRDITSQKVMKRLCEWKPDIIHYLTGPQSRSFVILELMKWIGRSKISVMSAPRPVIPVSHFKWLQLIQPDIMLSQSHLHTQTFRGYGFKAQFFPNGVDTRRFQALDWEYKKTFRKKYEVPLDKYVVLHTGYIAKRRGVKLMAKLAREPGVFVILVAATSWIAPDPALLAELETAGCRLFLEFLPNVEEIYQLSDCFVFPGAELEKETSQFEKLNQSPSIEIPLSVLEALSCGLPVVSKKFGGLEDMFGKKGIYFADSEQEIIDQVNYMKENMDIAPALPDMTPYTWERIVMKLEKIYSDLLGENE